MIMGCLSILGCGHYCQTTKILKMKRNFDVKHIIYLKNGSKKIVSKRRGKSSGNEYVLLCEFTVLVELSVISTRRSKKGSLILRKIVKFSAKLLKKLVGGVLSL